MISSLLINFFKKHLKEPKALLLGFSGGPDSLALLHLLLELKNSFNVQVALAHVDHGWRMESKDEALKIEEMANQLGLKFYLKRLDPNLLNGNLEAACRHERLEFFLEICKECDYDAVLLAHHADDLAETVLKRIFEGASIFKLGGIEETSTYKSANGEMKILRPLLKTVKKDILEYLKIRNLNGFYDKTNDDEKFLRARMRKTVFPYLEQAFGKEVSQNLRHLSEESIEINEHLKEKVTPILNAAVSGPFGSLLDLKNEIISNRPLSRYELKFLVKLFAERNEIFLSRESLIQVVDFLQNNKANKCIVAGNVESQKALYIDRMCLFLFKGRDFSISDSSIDVSLENLATKPTKFSNWQISAEDLPLATLEKIFELNVNWKTVWTGSFECVLPYGDYRIAFPDPAFLLRFEKKNLAKLWTDAKTPAFLRAFCPIVLKDDFVIQEFLTGIKNKKLFETCPPSLKLCRVKFTFL